MFSSFFFNDTATTEIYPLSLHDALPIWTGQEVKRSDANVAIYKDQLRELDAELAAGTLTPDDHSRARLELEARLLEDVPAVEVERAPVGGRRAALVVGIAVPLVAVAGYFMIGAPRALSPHEAEPPAAQIQAMVAPL